jgi:peptidoglycan-N-acetylglucosamine deacetylase
MRPRHYTFVKSFALWFCLLISVLLFVWPGYYQLLIPNNFSRAEALKGSNLPKGTLSFTFDDGPSDRTLELSRYLQGENIQATFFVIGKKIAGHETQLSEVKRLGHLIGNHTWSHPDLNHGLFCSWNSNATEITKTDQKLRAFVTPDKLLFRPPFGRWNHCLLEALRQKPLERYVGPVVWDIDGRDWDCWRHPNGSVRNCGLQYLNLIQQRGTGVVLMHDSIDQTTDMVRWLVPKLKKQGYKFVRLDEVPAIKQAFALKQQIARYSVP